jgi:hypothetical protein
MNFSAVLEALNHASAFELYRLRVAITEKLDDPKWIEAIRWRLRIGQEIQYFSWNHNALRRARIVEFRRKQVDVLDLTDGKRWLIDFCTINVDGVDVQVREHVHKGMGRNEVVVGQTLGFVGRDGNEHSGVVLRRNNKTVTMQVGAQQWRVGYGLLHPVHDAIPGEALDLGAPAQTTLLPAAKS